MSVSSQETGGVLPEGCKGGKEGNMVMDNGMQQLKAGNGDEQRKKLRIQWEDWPLIERMFTGE